LKPCGYLDSIFGEGLDNYIAFLWPLESNHFENGIPPTPSPPWSFHLLFLTQIFHICASCLCFVFEEVVGGWRSWFREFKAENVNQDDEDSIDSADDSTCFRGFLTIDRFNKDSSKDSTDSTKTLRR
jgi:hypothetical protein